MGKDVLFRERFNLDAEWRVSTGLQDDKTRSSGSGEGDSQQTLPLARRKPVHTVKLDQGTAECADWLEIDQVTHPLDELVGPIIRMSTTPW